MKVYFNTMKFLSRSFHRIEKYFKQYAPKEIKWVDSLEDADFIIEQLVGSNPDLLSKLNIGKPYAIIFNGGIRDGLAEYFKNAKWVFSFLPVENEGFEGNFILSPLGVDSSIFKRIEGINKDIDIITTGYVAYSEGIDSVIMANTKNNGNLVHMGGDLIHDLKQPVQTIGGVRRVEGITDNELVHLYNRAKYVSGLRRTEGFELPVIEGLLCGARPICFDSPIYRRWFDGLVTFIPELDDKDELAEKILEVFKGPYKPVLPSEQEYVKNYFSWEKISQSFWNGLKI
ncbi:glycosyltransferase [Cytobacillus massiliigabonensis]|uniref:glycosyltransferase n=1 Tax=Cytobacillus massiliigabonensis TaxID=1871011 RepID=UPI000C828F18|nr:glycosyltransferase [Cytobacillus massiliigabonensis]